MKVIYVLLVLSLVLAGTMLPATTTAVLGTVAVMSLVSHLSLSRRLEDAEEEILEMNRRLVGGSFRGTKTRRLERAP